MKKFKIII